MKYDLIGKKFSRLTVVGLGPTKNNRRTWECLCECGKTTFVQTSNLTKNKTKSCGCLQREKASLANRDNLIGENFGRLKVIDYQNGYNICQCECGSICRIKTANLKSGHTKSCGCLQKELTSKAKLIDIIGEKFGKLTVIERVKEEDSQVWYKCKCDCGSEIVTTSFRLRHGITKSCGCIQSFGEEKISEILNLNQINYQKEFTFPDLIGENGKRYRFDFAIFDSDGKLLNLIEFDGKQQYLGGFSEDLTTIQKRDVIKNNYCYRNKIPLIRIPYTYYEKISLNDLLVDTSNFIMRNIDDDVDGR